MSAYAPDGTPIANTWQGVFPVYNSGDSLHPNDAGYAAMANAVNLALLS